MDLSTKGCTAHKIMAIALLPAVSRRPVKRSASHPSTKKAIWRKESQCVWTAVSPSIWKYTRELARSWQQCRCKMRNLWDNCKASQEALPANSKIWKYSLHLQANSLLFTIVNIWLVFKSCKTLLYITSAVTFRGHFNGYFFHFLWPTSKNTIKTIYSNIIWI